MYDARECVMMAGYDKAAADCAAIEYSDKELWEAFDYLLEKGKKAACYKFVFLLGLLDELEKIDEGRQMMFLVAFRGFTEQYWQAMKDFPEYFAKTHEVAAKVIRDYMNVYGTNFSMVPIEMQTKLVVEITRKCQRNVVGAACADLNCRVYGYDKAEQRMWFNVSAYAFMKRNMDALRRKTKTGLVGLVASNSEMYFLTERDIEKMTIDLPIKWSIPIKRGLVCFTKKYLISRRYNLADMRPSGDLSVSIDKACLESVLQFVKPQIFRKEIYEQFVKWYGVETSEEKKDVLDTNMPEKKFEDGYLPEDRIGYMLSFLPAKYHEIVKCELIKFTRIYKEADNKKKDEMTRCEKMKVNISWEKFTLILNHVPPGRLYETVEHALWDWYKKNSIAYRDIEDDFVCEDKCLFTVHKLDDILKHLHMDIEFKRQMKCELTYLTKDYAEANVVEKGRMTVYEKKPYQYLGMR